MTPKEKYDMERRNAFLPNPEDTETDILVKGIMKAMYEGNYTVDIDGPNCVEEKHHPDGSVFYVVYSMDDARSSTDAGACHVTVMDIEFTCDLNTGEWNCDEERLVENRELIEYIENSKDVISGENLGTDEIIAIYERAYNCECDEYYFESCDPPVGVEDITRLSELGLEEVNGYYLLEEINEADEDHEDKRWARLAKDEPDDYGKYPCVVFLFDNDENVIGELPCDESYDPEYDEFE